MLILPILRNKHINRYAMIKEYTSIMRNDFWYIVSKPEGKSVVSSKWIYKIKHVAYGSIEKFKVSFVARGLSQKERVDYGDTLSPVANYSYIRDIISIASIMRWRIHQMDVKIVFLNEIIEEEVYIEKPQGFEVHGRKSHVCRLKKDLYGLKQAPGSWYSRLKDTCRVWDLPRVRKILTCISYLLERILPYWLCILMIYFSQV
jgi:hypothetical protein